MTQILARRFDLIRGLSCFNQALASHLLARRAIYLDGARAIVMPTVIGKQTSVVSIDHHLAIFERIERTCLASPPNSPAECERI